MSFIASNNHELLKRFRIKIDEKIGYRICMMFHSYEKDKIILFPIMIVDKLLISLMNNSLHKYIHT
jgi:hypothetical protein